jgi:AcrR family transcriptional regulator
MRSVEKIIRPRGFDKEAALAAALREFWSRGFEGVSVDELTAAMGVSRPTLYTVFGGKEELFRRALDHYEREEATFYRDSAEAPTAKGVAERMLRGGLDMFLRGSNPPGCLYVTHLVARGAEADAIRAEIIARTRAGEQALYSRFERALREGDLPANADPVGLVHVLMGLVQGLAVQASSGAPRNALERMVNAALALWPTTAPDRTSLPGSSPASP